MEQKRSLKERIDVLAYSFMWISILLGLALGGLLAYSISKEFGDAVGIVTFLITGCVIIFLGYVGMVLLNAFGELCENVKIITGISNNQTALKTPETSQTNEQPLSETENHWSCPKCGNKVSNEYKYCHKCNYIKE